MTGFSPRPVERTPVSVLFSQRDRKGHDVVPLWIASVLGFGR
jgi:hypothetical protein